MKTRLFVIVVAALVGISPMMAQPNLPEASIPADFAGFVRLKVESGVGISELNVAAFSAQLLQPGRFDLDTFQGYDTLFPLNILDVEGATFSALVQPWVKDAVIVAYRRFESALQVSSDDLLVILPTDDIFRAATSLAAVIQLQDLPERSTYQDVTIYVGDRTAIALAPEAVFIGPLDLIEAGLDARSGKEKRLIDQPAYQAIHAASGDDPLLFAYLGGEQGISALSFLLGGDTSTEPLLRALGEAIKESHNEGTLEAALLTASLDAIGVSIHVDTLPLVEGIGLVVGPDNQRLRVRAEATFYAADQTTFSVTSDYNPAILDLIPQTAMVVQTGANARGAVYDLLSALPLTNFAGQILRAFPVEESAGSASEVIEPPSADDVLRAVTGFLSVLDSVGSFSLEDDLLSHFTGSYAVAMIPRPNNPTPGLNTPFDLLVLVQVGDGETALGGATRLLELLTSVENIEGETLDELLFNTVRDPDTGDVIARLGVVDDLLVLATGDALEPALAARRGDNRLIDRDRWQMVSEEVEPQLFVNLNALVSTFFAAPGTPVSSQANVLAARGELLGDGLFQIDVMLTLPTG